jgi:shikimate 5-dehydrogenase
VRLVQVKLLQSTADGTWYAVEMAVEHFHLFSGVAAA